MPEFIPSIEFQQRSRPSRSVRIPSQTTSSVGTDASHAPKFLLSTLHEALLHLLPVKRQKMMKHNYTAQLLRAEIHLQRAQLRYPQAKDTWMGRKTFFGLEGLQCRPHDIMLCGECATEKFCRFVAQSIMSCFFDLYASFKHSSVIMHWLSCCQLVVCEPKGFREFYRVEIKSTSEVCQLHSECAKVYRATFWSRVRV